MAPKTAEPEKKTETAEEVPASHFTETDLLTEWQIFLKNLRDRDIVIYSAVNGFVLSKIDETTVQVKYPSESAKVEFEKIQSEFLNHFRHKVNNFKIKTTFVMDVALKKEVMTKKKMFEKFAEINPLLNDLNDLMKFDFS